jgi:hypothetical protein
MASTPVAGGGFEQCYNAQAAVAAGSLLVVATDVVQAARGTFPAAPKVPRCTRDGYFVEQMHFPGCSD